MKFRSARHTNNLAPIINFYTNILDLKILGDFKDHDNYDGVFLGIPGADWHLEFTVSNEQANHKPDEDDLLVFYASSVTEYEAILKKFAENNIQPIEAKNPYWRIHGTNFLDPDGFGIMIAINTN